LFKKDFSAIKFAQKSRKIQFLVKNSSFKGKKSSFRIFDKIEFPSKRTKNKPVLFPLSHSTFKEQKQNDHLTVKFGYDSTVSV